MVNKRGWLRIVEASVAVMIILASILVVSKQVSLENVSKTSQLNLLEEISSNISIRSEIVGYDTSYPIHTNQKNEKIILDISRAIESRIDNPALDFQFIICNLEDKCLAENIPEGEVVSEERIIGSNVTDFSGLKRVKLFYWMGQ